MFSSIQVILNALQPARKAVLDFVHVENVLLVFLGLLLGLQPCLRWQADFLFLHVFSVPGLRHVDRNQSPC